MVLLGVLMERIHVQSIKESKRLGIDNEETNNH